MKPIQLLMSAFGPYAGEVTLDFKALGAERLFLICGPTGAGKSTILDAMCYALYGDTSGGERSGAGLRSDYASLDRLTFVKFTFSIGQKRYRIERMPDQMRASKRKTGGAVPQKMESALYELLPGGTERLITAKQTASEAERLLGVGISQFRQIILLPQGDFRRLLLADSKERQAIMQQLFHTEKYAQLQTLLSQRSADLERKWNEGVQQMKTLLTTCGAESQAELADKLGAAKKELAAAAGTLTGAEAAQKAFQTGYTAALTLSGAFERLDAAKVKSQELAAQKEAFAAMAVRADRISAAARLQDAKDNLDRTLAQGKAKKQELDRCLAKEEKLAAANKKAGAVLDALLAEKEAQQKNLEEAARMEQMEKPAAAFGAAEEAARDSGKALQAARSLWDSAKKKADQADQGKKDSAQCAKAMRYLFLSGQAAYLAKDLEEGKPCPVCGSVHHPHPAVPEGELPEKEQVEKAERQAAEAEKIAERLAKEAEAKRAAAEKASAAYERACADVEALRKQVPEAYRDAAHLRQAIQKRRDAAAQYEKDLARAQEEAQRLARDYTAAQTEGKNLAAQREELIRQWHTDKDTLLAKAQAEGFRDLEEFTPYFNDREEEPRLRKAVTNYQAEVKAEADKMAAEKKTIGEAKRPRMDLWEQQREEKDRAVRDAAAGKARWEHEKDQLTRIGKEAALQEAKNKDIEEKHAVAESLSMLIAGKTTKVNLERFVLGALLDDVLRKANLRLKVMSAGRYELSRRREAEDKRKNTGLDMDVFDNYTGACRPANTLSGGETFLASLSLALGLADVVQEYAGGIHLDAMFIDEGFGTLDAESLDLALKTLTTLQGKGRLIGIISHVAELEERIPAKLRITKTDCGSSAAFEVR